MATGRRRGALQTWGQARGRHARDHLPQQHAERVDVRALWLSVRQTCGLTGEDVGRLADGLARQPAYGESHIARHHKGLRLGIHGLGLA